VTAGESTERRILVLNRFDSGVGCDYVGYIDHRANRVSYVTTRAGRSGVDAEAAQMVAVVDDLANWSAVSSLAEEIVARFGPLDHVVALFERDQETAAGLRELLGIPGPRRSDVAAVRDKVRMKERVAAAGLRVPRFVAARSARDVHELAGETGFPVVLKPRDGSGSQGIYLINSAASLDEALAMPLHDYECEEFVTGVMYQIDGVVQDAVVRVLRASRVLNSCLDYALGEWFGAVANDDSDLEARFVGYCEAVLAALGVRDSVFHLEVFAVEPAGPGPYDGLVFLEAAARPGGAEVPAIWREVYGIDLLEIAVRLQIGERPAPVLPVDLSGRAAGYLLIPEPASKPCRVRSVTSLIGDVPAMYAEVLPEPGAILNGTGGPKETGGRYRFRAGSAQEIEDAIRRVLADYRLDWEPVTDRTIDVVRPVGRAQSVSLP
jgi:ATP-grasp domain